MGFRFRRSIRLGRGLRINLSKSGASLSVGRPGATVNFGPKGERITVGLPGTGISYSTRLGEPHATPHVAPPPAPDDTAIHDTGAVPQRPSSPAGRILAWLLTVAVIAGAGIGIYTANAGH